ncbi:hypothetical protein QE152_g35214 [Popillia japonica]|uniref:Uncharacterized protein n=1 Tax=Popillia japonica TaxID=7064 RepID=A0AAW1IFE3_POPJA
MQSGNYLPPMAVSPKVHFRYHDLQDAPAGSERGFTPSGWSSDENHVGLSVIESIGSFCANMKTSHRLHPLDPTLLGYL